MTIAWNSIFDNFGMKTVKYTDKNKGAYVPNGAQRAAIAAAGILPSKSRPADEFQILVLNNKIKSIGASFYHSERITDPSRPPEPRMGHGFISSSWLQVGDELVIGNIGSQLFAVKRPPSAVSDDEITQDIVARADENAILARAKKAKGKPSKKTVTREEFQRNLYVVAAAVIRARGKCEMPACSNALFFRFDGNPYLEVHHIVPLGEGGDDTFVNVAALCPHCHRELHFGKLKSTRRATLASYIATLK